MISRDVQLAPAVLLAHVSLPPQDEVDRLNLLAATIRQRDGREALITALNKELAQSLESPVSTTSPPVALSDGRIFSMCQLTDASAPACDVERMLEVATLSPGVDRPPSMDEISDARSDIRHPSADWAVLVRRDGVVFQARSSSNFAEALRIYVRTIYADVFALARLQSQLLGTLSSRLANCALKSPINVGEVQVAAHDTAVFRAAYVWRNLSDSLTANRLMTDYQTQHDLDGSLRDLREDAASLAQTASLRAATLAQRSADRTNASLGILTAVGLPLGVAVAIWQGLGGGGQRLLIAIGAAVFLSAVALLVVPGLRSLTLSVHGGTDES